MHTNPENHYKYCPRCSSKGIFNNTELSFKCEKCGFHFFLNSAAAVTALIFNNKGELLLSTRGIEPFLGKLDLPGGFVDPGENAETALLREMKEELDIEPHSISYFGSFANQYLFSGTVVHTVDIVFTCKIENLESIKPHDDITGLNFINPCNIDLNDIPFESVKNIIKHLQK